MLFVTTACRYGLAAPEHAPVSSSESSAEIADSNGDAAPGGGAGRRHLSAKERKLIKKQVGHITSLLMEHGHFIAVEHYCCAWG